MAAAMRLSVGVGTRTGGVGGGVSAAARGMIGAGGAARAGAGALVRVVGRRGIGVGGSPDSELSVADRVLRLERGAAGEGTVVEARVVVGVVGVGWWGAVGET